MPDAVAWPVTRTRQKSKNTKTQERILRYRKGIAKIRKERKTDE